MINHKTNIIIFSLVTLLFTHSYGMRQIGSKAKHISLIPVPKTITPKIQPTPITVSPTTQQPSSIKTEKSRMPLEKPKKSSSSAGHTPIIPEKPAQSIVSPEVRAEIKLKNNLEKYQSLIQKAKIYTLNVKQFEEKMSYVENPEEFKLSVQQINALMKEFSDLESAVQTKDHTIKLSKLIEKAQEIADEKIDLKPFEDLVQSLTNETNIKTLIENKDELLIKITDLKEEMNRRENKKREQKEESAQQLKLAEEIAELQAREELEVKAQEERQKKIVEEQAQLIKDIQIKQETEKQITERQEEQKQLEQKQEKAITNKTEQEEITQEIAQNKAETEHLEQKLEEKTIAIENQTEIIKKDEVDLEQKTAEIETTHSQKEALEKEKESLKSAEKIKPEGQLLTQVPELISEKPIETIKTEENKPKDETIETEQKEEGKQEGSNESKMPQEEKREEIKIENKEEEKEEIETPKMPILVEKEQEPIPAKEQEIITEVSVPQITPEIAATQPKQEIFPAVTQEESTIADLTEQENITPSFARPTSATGSPWPKPSTIPFVKPNMPAYNPIASYGATGTPPKAESVGWTTPADLMTPYTQRIELPPRVMSKEETPTTEIKQEKKVQPQDIVWWEQLLPKWVVEYLGRKDRIARTEQKAEEVTKSTQFATPEAEPQKKEAGIIETIIKVVKKPISNAINYIKRLINI